MLDLVQPLAARRQRVGFGGEARRNEAGGKSTRTGMLMDAFTEARLVQESVARERKHVGRHENTKNERATARVACPSARETPSRPKSGASVCSCVYRWRRSIAAAMRGAVEFMGPRGLQTSLWPERLQSIGLGRWRRLCLLMAYSRRSSVAARRA